MSFVNSQGCIFCCTFLMLLLFLSGEATKIISIFEKRKSLWWFWIFIAISYTQRNFSFKQQNTKFLQAQQSEDTPYATFPNY